VSSNYHVKRHFSSGRIFSNSLNLMWRGHYVTIVYVDGSMGAQKHCGSLFILRLNSTELYKIVQPVLEIYFVLINVPHSIVTAMWLEVVVRSLLRGWIVLWK
jgi:hypothetical protein